MELSAELKSVMDVMASGKPYDDGHPALNVRRKEVNELTAAYHAAEEPAAKQAVLEELFDEVGENAMLLEPFDIEFGCFTKIGRNFFANQSLILYDCAPVTIGNDVRIGPRVSIIASNHSTDPYERRIGGIYAEPIVIEDDVWVGAHCVILPGVRIGAGSIIGTIAAIAVLSVFVYFIARPNRFESNYKKKA